MWQTSLLFADNDALWINSQRQVAETLWPPVHLNINTNVYIFAKISFANLYITACILSLVFEFQRQAVGAYLCLSPNVAGDYVALKKKPNNFVFSSELLSAKQTALMIQKSHFLKQCAHSVSKWSPYAASTFVLGLSYLWPLLQKFQQKTDNNNPFFLM